MVREAGKAPNRVEPKTVVALGPACADLGVALEHSRTDADLREGARGREPRRASADHDDGRVIGHPGQLSTARGSASCGHATQRFALGQEGAPKTSELTPLKDGGS